MSKRFLGFCMGAALLATVAISCGNPAGPDTSDTSDGVSNMLPASVGTNPFDGNTYTGTQQDGTVVTYTFAGDTVTVKTTSSSSGGDVSENEAMCKYTVNADTKVLSMQLYKMKSESGWLTYEDLVREFQAQIDAMGEMTPEIEAEVNEMLAETRKEFEMLFQSKYEENNGILTLTEKYTESASSLYGINDAGVSVFIYGGMMDIYQGGNSWRGPFSDGTCTLSPDSGNTNSNPLSATCTKGGSAESPTVKVTLTVDGTSSTVDCIFTPTTMTLTRK